MAGIARVAGVAGIARVAGAAGIAGVIVNCSHRLHAESLESFGSLG